MARIGEEGQFQGGLTVQEEDLEFEEGSRREAPVLIKAYGEYWNPDLVDWDAKQLLGHRFRERGRNINAYEQIGVYVLYKDYQPVYVGSSARQSIGNRLAGHRRSKRRGPRWDTFSWFGIREILKSGNLKDHRKTFSVTSEKLIATLEALLIRAIDPRLNSRREKLRNAVSLSQSEPMDILDPLERRMKKIDEKLEELLQGRGSKSAHIKLTNRV